MQHRRTCTWIVCMWDTNWCVCVWVWYTYIYIVCVCVFLFIYIDQVTYTFISVINDMYIHVYTRARVCVRAHPCFYIWYIWSLYIYMHIWVILGQNWIQKKTGSTVRRSRPSCHQPFVPGVRYLPSGQSTTFRWGFVDVLVNLISSCLGYLAGLQLLFL